MDPSKSISIRTSIDVPSFPRSKWDSENELSDNDDNVFEKSPEQNIILTKDPIISDNRLVALDPELESESEPEPEPETEPPKSQPELKPKSPKPKPELKESKQSSIDHRK